MSPSVVSIYTDGACSGNPGPGGYGVVLLSGSLRKELSGGFRLTTNNRMELLAAITGLEALKLDGLVVRLYTDSQYLVNAVNNGWLFSWEKKRFAKKKNPDLWIRFLEVYRRHRVTLVWVKGHNNDPENERCDTLAVAASKLPGLPEDEGYKANGDDEEII
ncbi:MAG: ribonuclease HI [Bacteroidales bacterium]|jgi:ribonuclease HI|nr:ribonuclease HI [Bacteroidales bacterium]MDX9926904.1 ribonuclease HI [Bacteroidales bacterium]NLD63586.1 ribonuclease HI [Bacteroidales bacterium]HNX85253.1 ribonuclease HI [Bacteroidales bacterium]HOC47823.1 ribonuclease HI [Bacteroidales bacterium]